jgi:hypothetical protein
MNRPQRGDDILSWAHGIQNAVEALRPESSGNVRISQAGRGFIATARQQPRRLPRPGPFGVSIVDAADSGGDLTSITVRVADGRVFLSEDWEDLADVADLTDTDCELSAAGDSVWLELHQTGDETPVITLEHGAVWTEFPAMWKYVPPATESADPEVYGYQRLAFLRAPRTGEAAMKIGGVALVLEQVVKTDLIVRRECVGSVTAYKVPQLWPWH